MHDDFYNTFSHIGDTDMFQGLHNTEDVADFLIGANIQVSDLTDEELGCFLDQVVIPDLRPHGISFTESGNQLDFSSGVRFGSGNCTWCGGSGVQGGDRCGVCHGSGVKPY